MLTGQPFLFYSNGFETCSTQPHSFPKFSRIRNTISIPSHRYIRSVVETAGMGFSFFELCYFSIRSTFMKMQSSNCVPIKISIPRGSIVVLRNVVFPRDRSQSGVKSRFKVVFYRNNSTNKPRNALKLGPSEQYVAPPREGSSYALHFAFWPLGFKIEKLIFPPFQSPVRPVGFRITRFSSRYTIPNSPRFSGVSVNLSIPIISPSQIEIKRNASDFKRVAPIVNLDSSYESIFKPNPLNAKLLKDYESN